MQQRPDWAVHAVPVMRDIIAHPTLSAPEADTLRELTLAFQTDLAVQLLVAHALTNATLPTSRREFLIETMARTSLSPLPNIWLSALDLVLRESEWPVRVQAARLAGTRNVTALDDALARLNDQTNLPTELRLETLRATLSRRPKLTPSAFDLLLAQISPQAGPGSRLAAAELLGRAHWPDPENDPLRLAALVRGDRLIAPATLLPLWLQSEGGGGTGAAWSFITEAIANGWQPEEKDLQRIRARVPRDGDKLFEELIGLVAQRAATQREQVASYAELLTGGDPVRGQKWFVEKVACAACHRVRTQGGLVGPDLTKIGAIRAGRDLIESIVLPSATFAQGYDTFKLTLRDHEEFTGIRVRQPDDSFVLRTASGAEIRVLPEQLKSIEQLKLSIMPEGLLAALSRDEIRDLFAYLQSLK
jgi:putative heme-binding domain-containing protein